MHKNSFSGPKKLLLFAITSLIVCRVSMVLLFAADIIHLDYHSGWAFLYGGDYMRYFTVAHELSHFSIPVHGGYSIGYSLFLIPFIWIYHAASWEQIILPVAVFQSLILGSISIYLCAMIASRLSENLFVAILAAALWCFLPMGAYLFFIVCKSTLLLQSINVPSLLWIRMYSEPVNTICLMTAVYLLTSHFNKAALRKIVAFTAGMAFLVREDGIVFIVILFGYLLYKYFIKEIKFKTLFSLGCIITLVYLPQFYFNFKNTGNPLIPNHYPHAVLSGKEYGFVMWSFGHVLFLFNYIVSNWLFLTVFSLCLAVYIVLPIINKRNQEVLFVLYAIIFGYCAFYSFYGPTRTDIIRFVMPTYFALAITGASAIHTIWHFVSGKIANRVRYNTH